MTVKARNGSWHVRITKRIDGKNTLLFSGTFDTQKEAKAIDASKRLELERGELGDYKEARKTTLGDVLKRYGKEVVPHKSSYTGKDNSKIKCLCERHIATIAIARLEAHHFAEYRDMRRKEKGRGRATISKKTIKEELGLMRRVLEYAAGEWQITLPRGNPVNVHSLLEVVRNDAKKRKALPRDDGGSSYAFERKYIKAFENYGDGELALFARFAIETACRRSAILALRWEDINFKARIVMMKQKSKNKDETYKVPLSHRAIATLKRLGVKKAGKVFTWTHRDSITSATKRASVRAGLPMLTPHQFRHEATTRALAKGWTPAQVRALTGHKTTQMLDNYDHLQAEDVLKLLDK